MEESGVQSVRRVAVSGWIQMPIECAEKLDSKSRTKQVIFSNSKLSFIMYHLDIFLTNAESVTIVCYLGQQQRINNMITFRLLAYVLLAKKLAPPKLHVSIRAKDNDENSALHAHTYSVSQGL